jgi:MOSC domain-containing protein YiiM
MQLLSVNVGKVQPIENAKKSGKTGIYKMPTSAPVRIGRDGLEGDAIVDTDNHGGADQAVYVYGSADYDWWAKALGHDLAPGTFGDNLTITDLESAPICIGDRLHIGVVCLEATAPRIPCATLAARMGDPAFARRFREAERPGLYCRVIETGTVRAGEPVRLEPYREQTITILEMFRLYYDMTASEAAIRRELAAPIAIRARRDDEARLAALLAKAE